MKRRGGGAAGSPSVQNHRHSQSAMNVSKGNEEEERAEGGISRVHYLKWTADPETADDSGVTCARRLSSVMLAHARRLATTGAG